LIGCESLKTASGINWSINLNNTNTAAAAT
jgi:hypothetical protein